jgi:hypothetical protein
MNKLYSKKLTSWIVTAVFIVLVAGFSLINQPNALAQSETLPAPTESTPAPPGHTTNNMVCRSCSSKC